jgi:precorrin-2 dehydrogenase
MNLLGIFLKLEGRSCLVVGAGAVGEGKIRSLVESGAQVRVVAPQAAPAVRKWAKEGRIRWLRRPFRPGDLVRMFLVVVATPSRRVNARVYREAQRRGVLANVVDDPLHCDFYYPAVVRHGPLQIAISTEGRSPGLARRLRLELEARLAPRFGDWVEHLGGQRRRLLGQGLQRRRRMRLLERWTTPQSLKRFLVAGRAGQTREVET